MLRVAVWEWICIAKKKDWHQRRKNKLKYLLSSHMLKKCRTLKNITKDWRKQKKIKCLTWRVSGWVERKSSSVTTKQTNVQELVTKREKHVKTEHIPRILSCSFVLFYVSRTPTAWHCAPIAQFFHMHPTFRSLYRLLPVFTLVFSYS